MVTSRVEKSGFWPNGFISYKNVKQHPQSRSKKTAAPTPTELKESRHTTVLVHGADSTTPPSRGGREEWKGTKQTRPAAVTARSLGTDVASLQGDRPFPTPDSAQPKAIRVPLAGVCPEASL